MLAHGLVDTLIPLVEAPALSDEARIRRSRNLARLNRKLGVGYTSPCTYFIPSFFPFLVWNRKLDRSRLDPTKCSGCLEKWNSCSFSIKSTTKRRCHNHNWSLHISIPNSFIPPLYPHVVWHPGSGNPWSSFILCRPMSHHTTLSSLKNLLFRLTENISLLLFLSYLPLSLFLLP